MSIPAGTPPPKLARLRCCTPDRGLLDHRGNSSGTNDACAAVAVVERGHASNHGLDVMATVRPGARSVFRRATPVWEVSR